jgi:hypothetical protein
VTAFSQDRGVLGDEEHLVILGIYTRLAWEYDDFVTRPEQTPREGAGPLPALLLERGQLPGRLAVRNARMYCPPKKMVGKASLASLAVLSLAGGLL